MGKLIRDIFRQNTWANVSLIEFCMGLNEDQLRARAEGTYSDPRETMLHVVAAEQRYIERIAGKVFDPSVSERQFPGLETLLACAKENGSILEDLATTKPDDAVIRSTYLGTEYDTDVSLLLLQAINHGTEHRSQVKVALSLAGVTPPELDGWSYGEVANMNRPVS